MTGTLGSGSILAGYIPRLVEQHHRAGHTDRLITATGTLVSADISGFTALSERLAALGHEGAELLTTLLNRCFSAMIEACETRGGDIIKFGGDALLVLFTGEQHERDASIAMSRMRTIVSGNWETDSSKRVRLGISQGANSGTFEFSLTDIGHVELLVGGPAVSATVACEGEASRGQILVSPRTASRLPDSWVGPATASGARPLVQRRVLNDAGDLQPVPVDDRGTTGLEAFVPAELVDQLIVGVPGEHRQVVIAFVHIAGTDDLFEREGPLAVHQALTTIGNEVRAVMERHAVHLLASDTYVNGAKLILAAGAPVSTDADEDHTLLALHELFEADLPLPVRAGVNRGHVFVGDLGGPTRRTFTVMGDAVNLAARLMQHAQPGQVVVAESVLARAKTRFETVQLEPFSVKGKTQPVRAAVLVAPRDEGTDDHISHIGFVGRSDELAVLDGLADAAERGHGALVEICGEPGIGKSRLVREIVERHPALTMHKVRGGQYARNTPFLAVRRLLLELMGSDTTEPKDRGIELTAWVDRVMPEAAPWLPLLAIVLGTEVDPTDEVDRLAEQFRRDRLLAVTADAIDVALDRPVIVVAEDAHLFDSASLDVFNLLGARAHERPWLVLATVRPPGDVFRSRAHAMVLEALGADEVATLASAAGAIAGIAHRSDREAHLALLAERAGGNPLFLLELLSASESGGVDALPESVESLVTSRIDQLPAADRTLLREASVSGNLIDLSLVADAFGRPELGDEHRWRSLSDFLVEDRVGVQRFRHGMYRDVAYAGLSYRRRREAHLAIGSALEQRTADNIGPYAALLSLHFDNAKDRVRAWRYAVMGGEAAQRGYANHEAITLFERALENAGDEHASAPERSRVAEALGDVRELSGQYGEAVDAYQRSRAIETSEPEREVRLLRKIGAVRLREGQLSLALRWVSRARTEIARIESPERRALEEAEAALIRSGTLHRQGRHQKSATWAEAASRSADVSGDRLVRARAYNMLEVTHRTLNRPDAAHFSDLALEMYDGSGDLVGEANVLNNRGVRHYYAGQWQASIDDYERSRNLCREAGDVVGEALVTNNIAEILCLQGHFNAARRLFNDAKSSWESAGNTIGVAYVTANLAMVDARAGDPAAGLTLLDRAQASMDQLRVTALAQELELRRIECLLLADQPDEALDLGERLGHRVAAEHEGDEQVLVQLEPLIGIAHIRLGESDSAHEALVGAAERAHVMSDHYCEALALLGLAHLGDDAGAGERAKALLSGMGVTGTPRVIADRTTTSPPPTSG